MRGYFHYAGGGWLGADQYAVTYMARSIFLDMPIHVHIPGHAVLATGYQDAGAPYFYINAGWGGSCSGWYSLAEVPNNPKDCSSQGTIEVWVFIHPDKDIYVGPDWTGLKLDPDGSFLKPFHTLLAAKPAVPPGGHLFIRKDKYTTLDNAPIAFDKRMTITTYDGSAYIGGHFAATTKGVVKILKGGIMKIY